jgi:hypothetical protein
MYMCSRLIIQPHTKAEREREETEKNTCYLKITKKVDGPSINPFMSHPIGKGGGETSCHPFYSGGQRKSATKM